jgi:hypothetical protein
MTQNIIEQAGEIDGDFEEQVELIQLSQLICHLDDDPETSLAQSLALHLMSEHGVMDALHLDERDAADVHARLHLEGHQNHAVGDLRFRPGLALDGMMLNLQRREHVQRILVPAPRISG